ncbi:phenoloxidase-activating enzyme-like [Vanessa atalanta]|uniref:phenoloxidase-activating enzyme-like n=1 Tax=Vanessa atalanta TaxID=42275 RepID=UPI001FCD8199|nr:phenoloxidase-activating enzyme-like [Vanessa atalanta]
MKRIFKIVTFVTLTCIVFGQEDYCITPTGVDGKCVLLADCDKLRNLIKGTTLDREILKQWHCGFIRENPMVCCPVKTSTTTTTTTAATVTIPPEKRCVTLEGTYGTCVSLDSCPKVAKRLKEASEEDLEYVQRSRCIGSAMYSVCCDTPTDGNHRLTTKKPVTGLDRFSTNNMCTPKPGLPDPNKDCCGVDSASGNKIIYGVPTSIDQYPWLALIEYTRDYLCGGTLISSEYVLTAAHCLITTAKKSRGAKSVRLGEYNTTNNGPDCVEVEGDGLDCTSGAISIPIAETIIHPQYNTDKIVIQANDIALIKLEKLAPYDDFVRPICLPTFDITLSTPERDMRYFVAGWGAVDETHTRSDIKLHSDLIFVDQTSCRELYSRKGVSLVWDKQMCAGGELNKDSCKGDSGGPLMYQDEKKFELTGVISFGILQCGNQGKPSIYTKVYDYIPWIKSVVEP